ncbi:MAG TPA: restriction endonuclease subunit M [Candidatus Limicola stercorigallinarum]|nr:restriction endonuclease subunit M [Candidatus Limicola stercorigallinarum]
MISIKSLASFETGTAQFRIREDTGADSKTYSFYTQADLDDDLKQMPTSQTTRKCMRTSDSVVTVATGDVLFSLVSGSAAIVQAERSGLLITQNYVVIKPSNNIDPRFLVYLLNENPEIRKQLRIGQQGSATMKYTLKQLTSLQAPPIPDFRRQALIGETYLNQLRLTALRNHASELETMLVFDMLKEANHHE